MTPLFRAAVLPLVLLLAACWAGKPFYSKDDLRAPIAAGLYRAVDTATSEEEGRYRISVRPDGYTAFTRLDRDTRTQIAGFAPLPGRDGLFVAWLTPSRAKAGDGDAIFYGMLERRGSEYIIIFPGCSDPTMAKCFFEDRDGFEAGLRRVAAEGPAEKLRFVPLDEAAGD